MVMKPKTLKSLLGKFIIAQQVLAYCHVEKVVTIEGNEGIAIVMCKTVNGGALCWVVECSWETDVRGIHKIMGYNILKEYNVYDYQDQAL